MGHFLLIVFSTCLFCLLLGMFLFFRSAKAIELQRRFYLLINWRIEPVSMEKELRVTRYMGIILIVMAMVVIINVLFKYKA
jgi:hypothetical protein